LKNKEASIVLVIVKVQHSGNSSPTDFTGNGGSESPFAVSLPGMRSPAFPIDQYVLIYRELPESVELLRALHGARDIPALFEDF